MALPIKHTPVLEGESSKRFNDIIKSSSQKTVSKDEIRSIKALTASILSKK